MLPPAPVFRIFVSSTFADLREEREALHTLVFPLIHRLCEDRGARFDAVDLRWGISEEAGRDQRTMRVCLEEVRRCQAATPRPNFIILLGDRYGWQPLPPEVPVDEFLQIREVAARLKGPGVLEGLYPRIDRNADPPVYCLRPKQSESRDAWRDLELEGVALFRAAAKELGFSQAKRATYGGSATEQEVFQGLLTDSVLPQAREHVHAFLRETEGTLDQSAAQFLFDSIGGKPAEHGREAARDLKERLRSCLPETSVHTYPVAWTGSGLDYGYLGEVNPEPRAAAVASGEVLTVRQPLNLCQDFYEVVTRIIEAELGDKRKAASLEAEIFAHNAFARERGDERFFTGREAALRSVDAYLDSDKTSGMAVVGASGSGKSTLMARALLDRRKRPGEAIVIARFIGVTPDSSDGRALLAGLSAEIAQRYNRTPPPVAAEFANLVAVFQNHLQLASQDPKQRPLIIFLDALDQLSEVNRERELRWLPLEKLPARVRLVVSVAGDREPSATVRAKAAGAFIELSKMPASEGHMLLSRLLSDAKRRLMPEQHAELLRRFDESGLPLYLRFAFEQARLWRSFDGSPALPNDVEGIIHHLLSTLSEPARHGDALVRASLGYLASSREGLTEDEILGLLWKDPKVREDFRARFPDSPPAQSLPRVVWSLLYYDLKQYLTERNTNGVPVVSFFHRQMRRTALSAYAPGEERRRIHSVLARWFAPGDDTPRDGLRFNVRSVTELPYQQRRAGMWQELQDTLCDLSFIEAKCAAGLLYDLLADFDAALRSTELTPEQRGRISAFARFVRAQAHVIGRRPRLTLQQAFNEPDSTMVNEAARQAVKIAADPYFRYVNKPQTVSPCVLTLSGHTGILSACAFSPEGSKIVSAAGNGEIRIWEAASGRLLAAFRNHDASIESCAFSHDGRSILCAARDGRVQLCDSESGRVLQELTRRAPVAVCRFSRDDTKVICASWDGFVTIWDLATSAEFRVFRHPEQVYGCAFSADEKIVASGGADGFLRFWDIETGAELQDVKAHDGPIMDCKFSDDGRRVFTSSQDGSVKEWDFSTRELTRTYEGHDLPVWAIDISTKTGKLVSASQDGTLMVWDTTTGEQLARVKEHLSEIWGVALAPDGKRAVTASWDMTLKIWSMDAVDEASQVTRPVSGGSREGKGLWGYMIACCCSPDGRYYAAASSDTSVRVWDAASGRSLGAHPIHNDYVFCCAFSPDSRWIVSGCWNGAVKLLEVGSWTTVDLTRHADMVFAAGFLQDGKRIFSCSTDGLRVYDFDGVRAVERSFWNEARPSVCAVAPDGNWFIAGLESGEIAIVDTASGAYSRFSGRHEGLSCCALSKTGETLATGSEHGGIKLWDVASRREMLEARPYQVKVVACNFSPDGRRLVAGSWDPLIKVLDVAAPGEPALVLRGHTDQIQDCCFTADGKRILSTGLDGSLRLWDSRTGAYIGSLLAPADTASVCRLQAGAPAAITASHRNSARLWDTTSGSLRSVLRGHTNAIRACEFSNEGKVVTGSDDTTLRVWDLRSGTSLATLSGHQGPVRSCAFSADGKWIVSGSGDRTVGVWDAVTGSLVRLLTGHEDSVSFVFALPDGRVVSCGGDGTVRIWDLATGSPLRVFGSDGIIGSAAVSAAGSRIAAGCEDGTLRIWDLTTGRLAVTLNGHTGAVRHCVFAERLASASMDGTLRLWDPEGAATPAILEGHAAPVLTCAFSNLGRSVVSGSEDGFVKLWDAATGREVAEYWAGAAVESVGAQAEGGAFGIGDRAGNFHLIELLNPGIVV